MKKIVSRALKVVRYGCEIPPRVAPQTFSGRACDIYNAAYDIGSRCNSRNRRIGGKIKCVASGFARRALGRLARNIGRAILRGRRRS